ncbi:hypothetical protein TWF970_004171 [Orbilia oligospora]|uniref:NACHT domain-containing protein n=1 Tax=Orbilia oligospora TaxID=2813651 RepID=A0A7C8VF57_ORBOL|nr:hypothetical protein TWF970_004171 [Orbilia oligospora]
MSQQIIAGPTGSNTPGQQRLTTALANFRTQLDPADQTTLNQISQPDVTAVTQFCAKFDSDSNLRRKRLGEKLQPFLLFIQSLGDVIGVYIQSDPTIAAHVWGTVKLVLQISSNYFDYFIKISDMIVKLQHHCPRIERIGKLFQNSQKLQDAILGFYAIIVEFCLKQFVKSIWKPFKVQFADLEGQLEEQRHMIDDEVLIASELAAHQAAQCTLIYQNRGYTHREFEVNQWTRNKEWQLKQDLAAKSTFLEPITRSFSNARGRRHPETGKWFFQLPEFKNWDAALDSSALWYNGIPGSGKSILATSVIEHLYTLHKNKKTSIIYFFCDFHTPETLRYRNILSSLLKQAVILNTTLSNQAQAELETSYLDSQFLPDAYKIEAFFSQFAQKLGTLYILIDGIDECPEEERLDLIAFLKRFLARNLQQTKFILSSRPDIEIPRALPISYRISISSAASRPDLEAYISHELESKCPNLEVYSPQINQDIKQALLKGANGMFLWVYFQIQDIRRAGNKDKIYHLLSDLPRGLHETYARILHRIQEERDEDEAVMVFNWLSKCRRPLTLPELRDAIAIRIGDTRHDQISNRYNEDPERILQNCGGLVVINEQDQTVHYAHSTVAKYLLSGDDDENNLEGKEPRRRDIKISKADIAQLCATYLQLKDFTTEVSRVRKEYTTYTRPPKDWVIMFLPGKLRLLEPICRFTLEMVLGNQHQPDIGHATELVRPFHATTGPSVEAQAQPRFPCLNYVTEYWLHHFGDGSASELTSRAQHLETLLDELNLPFPYMPRIKGLEKPDANDLLLWACENDNAPLFAVLFFKSRPPLQATLLLSAHGFSAINIPKDATGDVGMVLSYAIQRSSLEVLRYILEDPPITFRTGIRSIRGTLNLALNEENPTELIYYHVAHKIYGTNCYQGSENYLLSMAARIGHLEVFNILLRVHLAVMPSGLGIKANKHLLLLRQAIDGGNNHIFKALFCTPGIRDTKAFRLSFALAVGRMNQELIRYLDCWSCFADDIWPANHAGLELPRIRGRAALTAEALAHFDLADDNPILIARARGYRGTVRLILKELSKLCNELVDITGRCNRMLSCISLEFLREAIIRGDIGYLELWENRVTEDDLRQLCPCKRYTLDLMHEAIRHKQIASVIWLFKVQHYTRSQVEEYKENALKCSDQDIIDFLETKWLETEN